MKKTNKALAIGLALWAVVTGSTLLAWAKTGAPAAESTPTLEAVTETVTPEEITQAAAPQEEEPKETIGMIGDTDAYLLAKIAMAEAEGEDLKGKALVIRVVLNRVENDAWPNTVEGVLYQKRQFTPMRDGRFNRVEPSAECYEALSMVLNGWDESEGAMYFEGNTNRSTWHSRNLQRLFTHGGHTFYR